jgi:hypothetical protein
MQIDQLFRPRSEVAVREISDGAVLVDMKSGGCFELNRVGFEIWKLLEPKASVTNICGALAGHYPVAHETLVADVQNLIDSLMRAGLVEASGPR